MAVNSDIEWTDTTWNAITGCTKVSAGCKNCYAEKRAERNQLLHDGRIRKALAEGKTNIKPNRYANGFQLTLHEDLIQKPLSWTKPMRIFVNSMSDLFHENVPLEFIKRLFEVMEKAHWHQFQILTKRAKRLSEDAVHLNWPSNVWQGVSVEDARVLERIDHLRQVPAAVRFLSLEPLLGPLPNLDLTGIHWVIVGGESQVGARPMDPDWARDIRDQCVAAGVPFFFKQFGGVNKKAAGRELDGRTWDEMPR